MLLQITYQDKATQTDKENTMEEILKAITTLCIKVDSMDNEIQKLKTNENNLKSKASQQYDYKNAKLSRPEDSKNPEIKGDVGKHLKTHNICLNIAAADMEEVQRWILSLLKPEERPTTRALKVGFISAELLIRYCKLIGHKYPDHICSKCNGEDNVIPDVQLE
ncbi:hypothetical protein H5410_056123 [Solanum commersonii]|uniref:Uncharacterized protein n=1 Tax=Solanum commersonii TaxID=4109 RepID=A0A9J5WKS5_SOLCO|nr:hypothetical protein H5410_056123 [Solanum commersonii]